MLPKKSTLLAFVYLPPFQSLFDFASPGAREWIFLLLLLPLLPLLDEARKLIARGP